MDENSFLKQLNKSFEEINEKVRLPESLENYMNFENKSYYKEYISEYKDSRTRKRFYISSVAVILLIILSAAVFVNISLVSKKNIYAYIDVDINPSIRIGIDRQNKIKETIPLNDDAKTLLNGLSLKNQSIKEGLNKITNGARKYGFIDRNVYKRILITAVLNQNEKGTKGLNKLVNDICRNVKELDEKNISVVVLTVQPEISKLATSNKISMGRYAIYKKAKETGINLSIQQMRVIPIEEIMDKVDLNWIKVSNLSDYDMKGKVYTSVSPIDKVKTKDNSKVLTTDKKKSQTPNPKQIKTTNTLEPQTTSSSEVTVNTPKTIDSKPVNTPINKTEQVCLPNELMVSGLIGEYYDNPDFTDLKVVKIDHAVNFTWDINSPDSLVGQDTFSVRWTGKIMTKYAEDYTFYAYADNGVRLWVNDVLLIDNWNVHSPKESKGTISLKAGVKYDIKVEYFENKGRSQVALSWSSNSQNKQVIPYKNFQHKAKLFQAEDAILSKAIIEKRYSNYTGSGYVNYNKDKGSYIEWAINADKPGLYIFNIKYSNASSVNRTMDISVNNDIVLGSVDFKSTGAWNAYENRSISVWLNQGINKIRATATMDDGGPNVDYLELMH